jgi:hypothetical protein
VACARHGNATLRSGVSCVWLTIGIPRGCAFFSEAKCGGRKVHLPDARLRCTIGLAYQAADARHPKWGELARRKARNLRRAVHFIAVCRRRKLPIGSVLPEKGTGRTVTILTTGWSCSCLTPARGAAIAFSQRSFCRDTEAESARDPTGRGGF